MLINGKAYQAIWLDETDQKTVRFINQNELPFRFVIDELHTAQDALNAIREMKVRGAPLIGVTAAFGIYLATLEAVKNKDPLQNIFSFAEKLRNVRPTAVNLDFAVNRLTETIRSFTNPEKLPEATLKATLNILNDETESCRQIGLHGFTVLDTIYKEKSKKTVNILTHCNAGWLACIDYGTATAPIYMAYDHGIPVHVWVDETRPRNQGSRLTAWELLQHGVPHTVIVDNAGGHLMQHGLVDLVIVGSDRTTRSGDVANKIGTYLKALAAKDNHVPFYVALPSSSIDFSIRNGFREIPIEQRDPDEVRYIEGLDQSERKKVLTMDPASPVSNYGFDVTPARLISGLITERGICEASEKGLAELFQEKF
ncbi:MAG: methylthioribose-1-phosphate isomerase [Bacteroides sp. SM23_62_1]|nr:MAG: methylthioribose-1-phosphate isomerase [Bacteroides sp. SM23_62_1]